MYISFIVANFVKIPLNLEHFVVGHQLPAVMLIGAITLRSTLRLQPINPHHLNPLTGTLAESAKPSPLCPVTRNGRRLCGLSHFHYINDLLIICLVIYLIS